MKMELKKKAIPQCFCAGYKSFFAIPRTTTLRGDGMGVRAFTLIELLVVVLIVGILSAIALPQYRLAVEKSRLTEALHNMRILEEHAKLYILENGYPSEGVGVNLQEIAPIQLSGGEWNENDNYQTKNFEYFASVDSDWGVFIECNRIDSYPYQFFIHGKDLKELSHICYNGDGDEMGTKICHSLETYGWEYADGSH